MNRDQALEELKLRVFDKDIIFRSLVVEAVMKELAKHFNADENLWGLAGLLHDIDYEKTRDLPEQHGIVGAEILDNLNFDEAIVYSVRAHNDINGIKRKRKMDKALYLADYVVQLAARLKAQNNTSDEALVLEVIEAVEQEATQLGKFDELGLEKSQFIELVIRTIGRI